MFKNRANVYESCVLSVEVNSWPAKIAQTAEPEVKLSEDGLLAEHLEPQEDVLFCFF